MDRPRVTLREMTEDEYRSYVDEVQGAVVRELVATMSEEEARATAAGGIAQYLPQGVATPRHTLVIAEDAAHARRNGYGSAILAEVEALVARDGMTRLGLNVVATNLAAIALYRKSGYAVSTMQMSKALS
jgi:ribosomal protein S18 acetylase RimI-like enzyme